MTNSSQFVGSIPEHYENGLGPRIFFDYADELAGRIGELEPGSVLELAAGTGIVTRRLRNVLPISSRLLATDLNSPMLEFARKKFDPNEPVSFATMDATQLDFDNESFDAVACQFGVMFFPDKEQSYSEVLRILNPGGHYIFNVWGSWQNNRFAEIVHKVISEYFPDDPPGFYKVPFGYHDIDVIRDSILDVGFERVEIESMEVISKIPSAENFAKGAVYGNPVYDEIIARDGDPAAIHDAVTQAFKNDLGDRMSLQAIFIDAVKAS